MRDDQRPKPDEPDERFEDALADLFGDDVPAPDATTTEPDDTAPHSESQPAASVPPEPSVATSSTSLEPPVPPVRQPVAGDRPAARRSWRFFVGLGCVACVGLLVLCVVTLAVIGFIVGDSPTATPAF